MRYIREGRLLRGYSHLTSSGRAVSIVDGRPIEWSYTSSCPRCGSFRRLPHRAGADSYTYSALGAHDCYSRTEQLPEQCKNLAGLEAYETDMNKHLKKWGRVL